MTGDPVLDWALGRWERQAGEALAKAMHELPKKRPIHPGCRCTEYTVRVGDELWKVLLPRPNACPVCKAITAARFDEIAQARAAAKVEEAIKGWLAKNGHPSIKVEGLPKGVDFESFTRVYSHLKRLVEECPKGVPRDGIRLSFRDGGARTFGEWIEAEHRLNLPARYFGNAPGLQQLGEKMVRLERMGQNPKGCTSPEYVTTHEFGHCLRRRVNSARYVGWSQASNREQICTNAGQNATEAFAEGFAMIRHTPPGDWPTAVRALYAMLKEEGVP